VSARTHELERLQHVPVDRATAFAFFSEPRNLAAITPPWIHFRILSAPVRLQRGSLLTYRLRLDGVPVRWVTEITDWRPDRSFTDVQRSGPYRSWTHTHRFVEVDGGTEIYDHVAYEVPGGPFSPLVHRLVSARLDRIFFFRARAIRELLGA
jgi:ligand-binding SRPBCC domain-containing protein